MDSDQIQDENYNDLNSNNNTLVDQTQLNEEIEMDITSSGKRQRSESNEEYWQTASKNSKKKTRNRNTISVQLPIQVNVTCKEKLPKQFALAKLLNQNEINDIEKIKYVNPYKLLVTFSKESSADKFIWCPKFGEFGWRRQKNWEVGLSYGIIRDIDLDLSEEDLIKHMYSEKEVISAKRLNKKDGGDWIPSETLRIGFKGPSLPSYILLFELKVRVEPYTFPVTQCSKCWRFGHIAKMCPTSKVLCPKCCNYHDTCDATKFKCANCSGNHMAMSKSCPTYKKEKRIREIMSELNCTYQAALSKYNISSPVSTPSDDRAPSPIIECKNTHGVQNSKQDSVDYLQENNPKPDSVTTNIKKKRGKKKKKKVSYHVSDNVIAELETSDSEEPAECSSGQASRSQDRNQPHWQSLSFSEAINKIKDFIKEKKESLVTYFKSIVKILIDWFTKLFTNFMPDLSKIIKMFDGNNG